MPFYASLGNHDDPNQRFYKPFNMNGERYYTFKKDKLGSPASASSRSTATTWTQEQLEWLEKELEASDSPWKIAFFHHPLYSSGARHGSEIDLRAQLEPLFVKYGDERRLCRTRALLRAAEAAEGDLLLHRGRRRRSCASATSLKTAMTAVGFDTDYTFMLVEIAGDTMHFQTLTRAGKTIDSGDFARPMPAQTQ